MQASLKDRLTFAEIMGLAERLEKRNGLVKRRPSGKPQRTPREPVEELMNVGNQSMDPRCRVYVFGRHDVLAIELFRNLTSLDALMEYLTEELHDEIGIRAIDDFGIVRTTRVEDMP